MEVQEVRTATSLLANSWSFTPCKRLYPPGHVFFEDGDIFCSILSKQIFLLDKELELDLEHSDCKVIVCDLVGCQKTFTSVTSYEAHYSSFHRNICLECNRTFPSNFLLDVHISENHDVLFKLMSNTKYTHKCLVESCPDKFSNDDERKEHLVSVHKYPPNFRFNRPTRKQRKSIKGASEDVEMTNNMQTGFSFLGKIETQASMYGYYQRLEFCNSENIAIPRTKLSSLQTFCRICVDVQASGKVNDNVTTTAWKESSAETMDVVNEATVEKRRIPKAICFGRGSTVAFQRRGQNRRGRK